VAHHRQAGGVRRRRDEDAAGCEHARRLGHDRLEGVRVEVLDEVRREHALRARVRTGAQPVEGVGPLHHQAGSGRGVHHPVVEVDALGLDARVAQQLQELASAARQLDDRPLGEQRHVVGEPGLGVRRVVRHVGVVVALEPGHAGLTVALAGTSSVVRRATSPRRRAARGRSVTAWSTGTPPPAPAPGQRDP
jgi:hypothetical protein